MALDSIIFRKNDIDQLPEVDGLTGSCRLRVQSVAYNIEPDSSGCYQIPLKEIFAGIVFQTYDSLSFIQGNLQRSVYRGLQVVDVVVEKDGAEAFSDRYLIAYGGMADGEASLILQGWLTSGPNIRPLYDDTMFLCFINAAGQGYKVWCRAWFWDQNLNKYDHCPDHYYAGATADGSASNHAYENTVPITKSKFPSWWAEYYTIEAVDFWWQPEEDEADPSAASDIIRFILCAPTSANITFAFRNGLGFLDSICSRGDVKDKPDYEQTSFISKDAESELSVSAQRWIEVNTGRCDSEALRRQWQEFFESDERYVVQDRTLRRIVVSDVNCEQQLLSYGSATFKYKLSKKEPGRTVSRTKLQDYNG